MNEKKAKRRRIVFGAVNLLLVIVSLVSLMCVSYISRLLAWEDYAARWQGEGELKFVQAACYLASDEKIDLSEVYTFRYAMLDKIHEAALDIDTEATLFSDAWSTTGKLNVSSDNGKGTVSVIAVGGDFFNFHPIKLLSGSYLTDRDVMEDRVLLDEELAWLLFGGTDLAGMRMKIEGVPFVVAGVIERETDFASEKAYTSGMGLYMSYAAYSKLVETAGISCYEIVLPEPVEGFTYNAVKDKFPISGGDIVDISSRYDFFKLFGLVKQFGTRSMQTLGVINPYWENAARCAEDWGALFALLTVATAIVPSCTVLVIVIKLLWRGKTKLEEDVIPDVKEKTEEKIRVRQRRAWEKKHGTHEKD